MSSTSSTTTPEVSATIESKLGIHTEADRDFPTHIEKVEDKVMCNLPQSAGSTEGKADDNPVALPSCTKSEFESLLEVLYPPPEFLSVREMSKEGFVSVLKLSTLWDMQQVRLFAIEKLSTKEIGVVEKIVLARRYNIPTWLIEGYTALITDWGSPSSKVTIEDLGSALGWETAAKVLDLAARANVGISTTIYQGDPCGATCFRSRFTPIQIKNPGETATLKCTFCDTSLVHAKMRAPNGRPLQDKIKASFKSELGGL
ncbi:hypothetical protein NMY22_g13304 [Coprinellus aureogranulatus]|nr:hypothetical protein NMY22_g13304 [Coprinellus aureogranulatus]